MEGEGDFALMLRVPSWCEEGCTVTLNGEGAEVPLAPGSYAEIRRTWRAGDTVRLRLPMPVRRVECHPYVAENAGRVALMRGPLLYCVEGADNPSLDPRDLVLSSGAETFASSHPELLGGVVALTTTAELHAPGDAWKDRLYRTVADDPDDGPAEAVEVTAVPYYAWANRHPGPMCVWLRSS